MSTIFFTSSGDGSFGLTTTGYVVFAVLMFAAVAIGAAVSNHRKNKKLTAKQLTFAAAAIALAFVTGMIKVIHLPMGGSVTLFSMLCITLIGYWYGPVTGILCGVAYGLLSLIVDPYIVSIPQMLIDYPLAFGALGFSGFFSEKKNGLITGYIAGVLGRLVFAVISGVVFFGQYAPEGTSPFIYSLSYNGFYLAAEGIITVILLLVPAISKAMNQLKRQAIQ